MTVLIVLAADVHSAFGFAEIQVLVRAIVVTCYHSRCVPLYQTHLLPSVPTPKPSCRVMLCCVVLRCAVFCCVALRFGVLCYGVF